MANEEVIRLSRKRKVGDWWDMRTERDWIDYIDTPQTNAMRDVMRRINAWLEQSTISFVDDGLEPVNVNDRTLQRFFVIHDG